MHPVPFTPAHVFAERPRLIPRTWGLPTALACLIALSALSAATRFIAATESLVSDANRAMLVRARMQDIVTTAAVTGVPSNWMRESLEAAGTPDGATLDEELAAGGPFAELVNESRKKLSKRR